MMIYNKPLSSAAFLAGGSLAMAMILYIFRKKSKSATSLATFTLGKAKPKTKVMKGVVEPPSRTASSELTGPVIWVHFGSQTGTAEEFAKIIVKEGRKQRMNMKLVDLEKFDASRFPGSFGIFLVATYGEGEPTDNAKQFYHWLLERSGGNSCSGMQYAVFGLGNTQYEHYNAFGKLLDSTFEREGGKRMLKLGLGDDDKNIREDFEDWVKKLWPALSEHLGLEQSSQQWMDEGVQYKMQVKAHGYTKPATNGCSFQSSNALDAVHVETLRVRENRELNKGGERSCRHVEFDILAPAVGYETGDHLAIFPENDMSMVKALAARLQVDLSLYITVKDSDGFSPFPCPCTVEEAFARYLDINSLPRKSFLVALAEFARDGSERERLLKLASKEGQDLYHQYVVLETRNLLDLLNDFPSVQPSLECLVELVPRLQSRYYSISSSNLVHPRCVHVTAVVVEKKYQDGRSFHGVCTSYLRRLHQGDIVRAHLRKTNFKLPREVSTPVILVGAGTGIAPLRGMCQELEHRKRMLAPIGKNLLFFGCRRPTEDYLYEEEIGGWLENGTLSRVHTAFSRSNDTLGGGKVYVQQRVDENAIQLLSLLDAGACIYVCGSTAMARDVKRVLCQSLIFLRRMKGNGAEAFLEDLAKEGRYHQDVWTT
ncbi:hypothetical protein GUITHDRAFT_149086 [Guillardia theta CCMP2712]|uniref:NADPH--hemoprotein reductase n=3 Tax=Guillardia theta TaxID=55529 RepID=L1I6Q7_GUITC|nr:hypothetical protein GUITHDRAFT_149086 [Guillardia theta CCMP2712]EKX31757.1 hypothetical protein GUITHDRAFT_149086 [Guillardia theta CCMP2712]|eukprot:XP_005818737.1 hypothetical protein GUITHDRAFT_149086 [Guillardia theta CCMP2712]